MDLFWKSIAGSLVGIILAAQFSNTEKHIGTLLKLLLCIMGMAVSAAFLRPVIEFLHELEKLGNLRSDLLLILLKSAGLGITAEIAADTCGEGGSPALGKMIKFLGTVTIMSVALPVFQTLLEIIQQIARAT